MIDAMVDKSVGNRLHTCPMCGAQVPVAESECRHCGESLRRRVTHATSERLSPARPVIAVQLVYLMLMFFVRHVDLQAVRNLSPTFPVAILGFPLAAIVRIWLKRQTWSENRYALAATALLSATTMLLFSLV